MGAAEKLDKPNIKKWDHLLDKLNDIPTLPLVATRVTELINDPNSSSGDIADVLKKDQVLTAKVLKLVNSPYYGIPGEVTDVQRALAYLGFNTLAQLVLSVSIISMFPEKDMGKFSMYEFWKHALGTAIASDLLAKKVNYPRPEECFTCGLLHDIGKIVLLQIAPDEFQKIVQNTEKKQISFAQAEQDLEVPPHGYLGEFIANKWRLPMIIRLSIRYHHFDVTKMDTILESQKPAIQIVGLANQIVNKEKIGYSGNSAEEVIKPEFLEALKISDEVLKEVAEKVHMEMANVSGFLRASG
jgi:HD-like signal output (HDOD) protein